MSNGFTTGKDIAHRFAFHAAPSEEKKMEHTSVRILLSDTALELNGKLPEGREKSLALTKLEEAMFWANAAIARNQ
jgi:hypothetical protein